MQNLAHNEQVSIPEHKITQIKELVEDSFMHDWVIRVQYALNSTPESVNWETWDESFFAIKDSTPLLEKIIECCSNNPDCSMRLICEHFNPDCRFVYSIPH